MGTTRLPDVSRTSSAAELIAGVVRDGFSRLWDQSGGVDATSGLADLLAVGESQTVEFKSTARRNTRAGQQDKKMEHVILKTVCGFLNAEGGTLLIGVDDDGQILGLTGDMKTLGSKGTRDGFELFLRQHLDNNLSVQTAGIVKLRFEVLGPADVCLCGLGGGIREAGLRPAAGGGAGTVGVLGPDRKRDQASSW